MATYIKIDLFYNGVFVRNPLSYDEGSHHLFEDVDFAGMDVRECKQFLERFTERRCVKVYYLLPWLSLAEGLKPMSSDLEYVDFIDVAYHSGCHVSMYIDHVGVNIEEWILEDKEEVLSPDPAVISDDGVEEEEEEDEYVTEDETNVLHMNRTWADPFLTKLSVVDCAKAGEEKDGRKGHGSDEGDNNSEEEDDAAQIENPTCYNESIEWNLQKPLLGMRFETPKQLKFMLCNYAVAGGFQLCFKKNDRNRLLVLCCGGDCSFRLWASWMRDEKSFQIKSLKHKHNCARNFKMGSIVTYSWIGSHFTRDFLHKQKMSVRQLKEEVKKMFGIDASMSQCRRAKSFALSLIDGTLVEHYARLWSYAEEIRRSNPGSNVKLDVNVLGNGTNYFSKFYVCFDGLKKGWLEGCRRIINLDGCFLKGICSGELLSAIGRDANNQIFPIAWAVVCVENKENWKWFLENLSEDLNLQSGGNVTLMSDQHKGLLEAVKELLPDAEHRQCARHIFSNFKRRFAGAHWEKMFWKASKSTTEQHFNAAMKEIQVLSQTAFQHLMDRNPKTWSRAFFLTGRGCDAVENRISESFNNLILDARKKPIITMLEEIRLYVMDRMYNLNVKGSNWDDLKVCPNIRTLLNELGTLQRFWQVLPCGYNQFEARNMNEAYTVDLEKRTCACRLWQLNGYGCVHSVATIAYLNRSVDDYVDPNLLATCYKRSYQFPLLGMNGSNMWPTTDYIPPHPPLTRRMPGRPTIKRKKDATETLGKHKVTRAGKRVLCGVCKVAGHNKITCPNNQPLPTQKPRKRSKNSRVDGKGDGGVEKGQSSMVGQAKGKSSQSSMVGQAKGKFSQSSMVGQAKGKCSKGGSKAKNRVFEANESQSQPQSEVSLETSSVRPRKMSERLLKKKLAKQVHGKNGEGDFPNKPMDLDED